MSLTRWLLLAALSSLATACEPAGSTSKLQDKVALLQGKVEALEKEHATATHTLDTLNLRMDSVEGEVHAHTATLDPADKSFQHVTTRDGFLFLVSISDIKPYANGFKAIVNLGNPTSLNYIGVDVEYDWGPSQPKDGDKLFEWSSKFQHGKQSITQTLRAGAWNPVELILTPATPTDIGQIDINSITVKTVTLLAR